MLDTTWYLDEALKLMKALQSGANKFGFHVAMGGSVPTNGKSVKDLDLYFLPLNNRNIPFEDPAALIHWLEEMWGRSTKIGAEYEGDPPQEDEGPSLTFGNGTRISFGGTTAPRPPTLGTIDSDGGVRYISKNWFSDEKSKPQEDDFKSCYRHKRKFIRHGGDRIDVFIV